MNINAVYTPETVTEKAKLLFSEEHGTKRLDGWFLIKEIQLECNERFSELPLELKSAKTLVEIAKRIPIRISENAIFVGSQSDAFAKSYALINPAFTVESFTGYCDPVAIYNDIEPDGTVTESRIAKARESDKQSRYIKALEEAYDCCREYTSEAAFFIEQVTGHVIPDMRSIIKHGISETKAELLRRTDTEDDGERRQNCEAMMTALDAVIILTERYARLAREMAQTAAPARRTELEYIAETLERIPAEGASCLYEAIQSYLLLWQVMCMEQAPNPYAFSVGNADRIFESYRQVDGMPRDMAAALFKHFLVFFNVGDRSWAISQNIILSGKDECGRDLTNECTYAFLDAFLDMNLPQPIVSVKLHKDTLPQIYEAMGRMFFTAGCLTPSLFNDDVLFDILRNDGIDEQDIKDYSIAGCQEPLIMGKENGNTTNSWLNLAKILELTLNNGYSTISGKQIPVPCTEDDVSERLKNVRELFYRNVDHCADLMVAAANKASEAIALQPVPFLSVLMGGVESGYDMRDVRHQGTKYNGSGCLIHGLCVVADSFIAIDCLLRERPQDAMRLMEALKTNYQNDEELRQYMRACPKFGNNEHATDDEARQIATRVSEIIAGKRNYLGNAFRPDFSTPTTHLLYGYWVGATPDGRNAREMLNYGVDPYYGGAQCGLGVRTLSSFSLPYEKMRGGCASHLGIDPKYFKAETKEGKGLEFRDRVIAPLFFNKANAGKTSPFYLYVNVTTAEMLRKVLADPKKYAPSGVFIMRIHGTFVNFLDLAPAIQNDIILRLDPASTAM